MILLFFCFACDKQYNFTPHKLFWSNFYSLKAIEVKNIKNNSVKVFDNLKEAPKIVIDRNLNPEFCEIYKGEILIGEYKVEVDSKNRKGFQYLDNIYLNLYEGTLLKYNLRLRILESNKNLPTVWEISNLMDYPYEVSKDTLLYKYVYIYPRGF